MTHERDKGAFSADIPDDAIADALEAVERSSRAPGPGPQAAPEIEVEEPAPPPSPSGPADVSRLSDEALARAMRYLRRRSALLFDEFVRRHRDGDFPRLGIDEIGEREQRAVDDAAQNRDSHEKAKQARHARKPESERHGVIGGASHDAAQTYLNMILSETRRLRLFCIAFRKKDYLSAHDPVRKPVPTYRDHAL